MGRKARAIKATSVIALWVVSLSLERERWSAPARSKEPPITLASTSLLATAAWRACMGSQAQMKPASPISRRSFVTSRARARVMAIIAR